MTDRARSRLYEKHVHMMLKFLVCIPLRRYKKLVTERAADLWANRQGPQYGALVVRVQD